LNNLPNSDPDFSDHVRCECGEIYHMEGEHSRTWIRCSKCNRRLAIPSGRTKGDNQQVPPGIPPVADRWQSDHKTGSSSFLFKHWKILLFVLAEIILAIIALHFFTKSPDRKLIDQFVGDQDKNPDVGFRSPEQRIVRQASSYPLKYSLGTFDGRFGITTRTFLDLVDQAKVLWETPVGMLLFQYDPSAPFKINLVYDEREERRIDERRMRTQINAAGKSFNDLKREYDSELDEKNELETSYNNRVFIFNKNMSRHKSKVSTWNDKGGAPPDDYAALQHEESDLKKTEESLERERTLLNNLISRVNALGREVNDLVSKYNLQIANYSGRFVGSREFEKGVFDGKEINIYEFDDESDLKATIVHELGHALGFPHVDDPNAIMYYKLEKQDLQTLHLTQADLDLLQHHFPKIMIIHAN
jgi:hypothetical protein